MFSTADHVNMLSHFVSEKLLARKPEDHWCANKHVQYGLDCNEVANAFEEYYSDFNKEQFLRDCGL